MEILVLPDWRGQLQNADKRVSQADACQELSFTDPGAWHVGFCVPCRACKRNSDTQYLQGLFQRFNPGNSKQCRVFKKMGNSRKTYSNWQERDRHV